MITLPIIESAAEPEAVDEKFAALEEGLRGCLPDGAVLAFSGGVDSAFLLWAAERVRRAEGGRLVALTTYSPSMSQADRDDAERFAAEVGAEHVWRESREFADDAYTRNDADRCYHCKTELFDIAREVAAEHGLRWILYGYNDSDRGDVRPGHRAALENGVLAPLAEAGLTKADIRALMREHGLDLADKPASPCLSSRVMTGVAIDPQMLGDVEALEKLLRDGGLRVFRVRIGGEPRFLRLEVDPAEMTRALELREAFAREGKRRGYRWVTLDLEGYRMGGGR